jgi:hypothetical protein
VFTGFRTVIPSQFKADMLTGMYRSQAEVLVVNH